MNPVDAKNQDLVAVMAEACVNGVSARKVKRLVEQLGVEAMSRSAVRRLCRVLDEQIRIFRIRAVEARYPCLWLDARAEACAKRAACARRPWW